MKLNNSDINIWTKLYRQTTFLILEYEVVSINTTKTQLKEFKSYTLKCLSCSHWWDKCLVNCVFNELLKNLSYVSMDNNDDEWYDNQSYWHNDIGKESMFYLDKKSCLIEWYKNCKYSYEQDIKKYTELIESRKKKIEQIDSKINALT